MYPILINIWMTIGIITFIILLIISAPYGRHSRSGWGLTIPKRLGWIVMESPALYLLWIYYFLYDGFSNPVLIFFLSVLGIVNAKFLLKNLRYAVLIIFIVAAVITPTPDIPTMMVFAMPMLLLYMVGVLVAWIFGKKRLKHED